MKTTHNKEDICLNLSYPTLQHPVNTANWQGQPIAGRAALGHGTTFLPFTCAVIFAWSVLED